ncbi:hypothetical protein Tco_1395648 [Tanacetum coccineum]|uniref:Uncharacterized protein n=1 Tax=Tanacetum coccineum TaxID=301880 RepID=A0ABQ5DBE9_9ASTR
MINKLQIEENKVESLKRDKAATENLLQEITDKKDAELATQKEHNMNALTAANEAKARVDSRANDEARTDCYAGLYLYLSNSIENGKPRAPQRSAG